MLNNSIGQSAHQLFTPSPFAPSRCGPQSAPNSPEPFSSPDVFRPSSPIDPKEQPFFPQQPVWLPPTPSLPQREVPFQFPMELPTLPDEKVFKQLPTPEHFPDWSKQPLELPHRSTPEIPQQDYPTNPGTTLPYSTWLMS